MKREKRAFIRELRGTGLTLPERAKLYRAVRRDKCFNADSWADTVKRVLPEKVYRISRESGCECCGDMYVKVVFPRRTVTIDNGGYGIVDALNAGL